MQREQPFTPAYNNLAMLFKEEATQQEPYDLDRLQEALQLVESAIKFDEELKGGDQALDDDLWDTQGQIYEALVAAIDQGVNIPEGRYPVFQIQSGVNVKEQLLGKTIESYKTAEQHSTYPRRAKFQEIINELERE